MTFTHLHNHTGYSLLDGLSSIEGMVAEAARLNQPAVAVTDHGSLGGVYELWDYARKAGIRAVAGMEAYVAPGARGLRERRYWGSENDRSEDIGGGGAYTHLTLLADGPEGLRNLFRLHARSYSEGFYFKPRIDVQLLEEHARGIICLSGCLGGELQTRLKLGQQHKSREYIDRMRSIFGDRFFIEVMHHGLPIEDRINPQLLELATATNTPVVATNDCHYTLPEDSDTHDALLCLQTYAKLSDSKRFRFEGSGYHLRSREEMELLPFPDAALDNTLLITEMIGDYDSVFEKNIRLPSIGDDVAILVGELATATIDYSPEYHDRIQHELDIITSRGYAGYFTTLQRIIRKAESEGIAVGPGRGSAGGSLVSYALGITRLDPIREGLLFERFLNPARVSLPDIDIDVSDSDRDRVLELCREEFGHGNVAQVGTYGTEASKSAIHDAGRVLGAGRTATDDLASYLPAPKFGRLPTLAEYSGPENEVIELARGLEGSIRTRGVHAAGVVISPQPLQDIIPLWQPTNTDHWVTAFHNSNDYPIVEKMGLTKYDFLGLRNLGVIDECLEMLRLQPRGLGGLLQTLGQHHTPRPGVEIQTHPLRNDIFPTRTDVCTDPKTFELLRSGHTLGVFQLDSPGMQQLLRSVKPNAFSDISAVLALYRPGPMGVNAHHSYAKRATSREPITYIHPELTEALTPILKETYGLVVYQEQVLEILKVVGGYDMTTASSIFDSMRKKLTEKMLEAKPDFYRRLEDRGFSADATQALWDVLVPFSDYSFNKSHTTGYGLISYWTAFLKANHPTEYMAALLSRTPPTTKDGVKRAHEYISEAKRLGIAILPPDINHSRFGWTPGPDDEIRYGIGTIKGVAEKAFVALDSKRPYRSLDNLLRTAPQKALNTGVLHSLIRAGALDSLCPYREELDQDIEGLVERAVADRKAARKGQLGIVDSPYEVRGRQLYNRRLRQQWEGELLGTELTQPRVTLKATRWLTPDEFEYLRRVRSDNPGGAAVTLQLGNSTVKWGRMTYSDSVKRLFSSLGVVEVSEK